MIFNCYEKICSFENLYKAFCKVSEEHKHKSCALIFYRDLEENLIQLQNELLWGVYELGNFFKFTRYEPKRREISALPYRDRIVQTAICNIIEPEISKRFIKDSYACQLNKGALKAANRMSYFLNKKDNYYFLKCDIHKYFDNVDLDIAFNLYKRHIDDTRTLNLIYKILHKDNPDKGIKIGNRLSQLTANLYLNELDYYVKQILHVKYYVRYMDDFIILGKTKRELNNILKQITLFLEQELHLELNTKTNIGLCSRGIEFVGYKIFRNRKLIKKQTENRVRRYVNSFIKGKVPAKRFCRSMASICGHAVHTTNYMFYIKQLLKVIRYLLKVEDL